MHPTSTPAGRARAILLSLLLVSCGGGDGTGVDDTDAVASVTVTPSSPTLDVGETLQLTATVRNGRGEVVGAPVTWATQDEDVASVVAGLVTGVSDGSTTITASADGEVGTATVTVRDPDPPAAPSDVQAEPASNTTVDVTWTDNSDTEDGFRIEREAVAGAGAAVGASTQGFTEVGTVGADVTSFRDTGLDPETGYRYRVLACNENGCSGPSGPSGGVTTFATLVVETDALPAGVENEPYEATLTASGGDGEVAWAVSGGALPPPLALAAATGVISGTPDTPGDFDFTVQAQGAGQTVTKDLSITIDEEILPPVVTVADLPNGVVGQAYGAALTAERGDGDYAWAVVAGAPPHGLALGADGSITGVPTAPGSFAFTVEVTSAGLTGSAALSIDVFDLLTVTTGVLTSGVSDMPYHQVLAAVGGDGSYTWTHVGGDLPPGLSLAGDGTLDGTPSATGTFDFTVGVSSGDGQVADADLSITVHDQVLPPQVTTTVLAEGGVGAAYSETLQAIDGDGSYTWAVVAGALPGGLDLDPATGEITGIPTGSGTAAFTVEVTSAGETGTAELSITIHDALVVATSSLPDGVEGQAYGEALLSDGGNGDDTWSLESGDLPDGLELSADGTISGTVGPQAVTGTFDFTVKVENTLGQEATRALSITIKAVLEITTTSLPDGEVGVAYSETLAATGGDGTYTWERTGGDALPDGLTLDGATGVISGTPTTSGTSNFTVEVSSGGQTDAQALAITVQGTPLVIETNFLAGGHVGAAYSDAVSASGGDGAYAFSVVAGTPPTSLSLDPDDGAITGTPTAAGVFHFTVEVSSGGNTATHTYMLTISDNASSGFNVFLHNVAGILPSAAVQTELNAAVAKLEQTVTGDIPSFTTTQFTESFCDGWAMDFNGVTIDDVEIFMDITAIDGPGMTLARAGPCAAAPRGGATAMPILGFMTMDADDLGKLDATQLRAVILHEMLHVMGIGTLWNNGGNSFVTGLGTADPRYTGTAGVDEYQKLGGGDPDVPVYGTGSDGDGSYGVHWRESTFNHELMTPFAESAGTPQPLSTMTIGSLSDVGWTVDLGAAESYAIPSPPPPGAPPAEENGLHDTIWDGPVAVFAEDGTLVTVIRPPE